MDALKGVVATVDGKPLPSFDPTKSGTYRVAKGAEVKISNVPSDWKLDKTASDSKLVFAASKDGTTVTWTSNTKARMMAEPPSTLVTMPEQKPEQQ